VTEEKQVIAYFGGGISATIDLLFLRRLGYENLMLYDGVADADWRRLYWAVKPNVEQWLSR
jgi:3-mercaptopyruvate sulfurtransferase SseA